MRIIIPATFTIILLLAMQQNSFSNDRIEKGHNQKIDKFLYATCNEDQECKEAIRKHRFECSGKLGSKQNNDNLKKNQSARGVEDVLKDLELSLKNVDSYMESAGDVSGVKMHNTMMDMFSGKITKKEFEARMAKKEQELQKIFLECITEKSGIKLN